MHNDVDYQSSTIDDSTMGSIVCRQLEKCGLRKVLGRKRIQFSLTKVLAYSSYEVIGRETDLKLIERGFQVIKPERTSDRYCLGCVTSPKQPVRVTTKAPQHWCTR